MSAAEQYGIPWILFRNILFAMDLSPGSLLAFPFAASMARHYGGKIFLAHVIADEEYDSVEPKTRGVLDKLETDTEKGLINAAGGLHDIPHEVLIDHGGVRMKLLDAANRCEIDLMVLGTHGWKGIKKLLSGSMAEEIAYLGTRPVLTVGPKASRTPDFRRILYETDLSATAAHAIPYASSIAHFYGASMLLLHVNEWTSAEPPVSATPKTFEFLRQQILRQSSMGSGDDCEVLVEYGSRTDCILAVAATREVDLIVIGLNCSKGIKARIAAHLPGSTVYDVVSEAHCPVLIVPYKG